MAEQQSYRLTDLNWSDGPHFVPSPYSTTYDELPTNASQTIRRKSLSAKNTLSDGDEVSLIRESNPQYDSATFHEPRPRPSFFLKTLWSWAPELWALVFAVISFLSIVIVLRIYDGRGIDKLNLPSGLTLNGLVAAIATLERVFLVVPVGSALSQEAWLWLHNNNRRTPVRSQLRDLSLSDNASRGAWGSLIVLPYAGRRWLTLVGALITILSLAIGTFSQQLIAYANLPVTDPTSPLSPGNVPLSNYYDSSHGNPAEDALTTELYIKAAIYNGLMADNIAPIEVNCPTGNCTFPFSPSLAVCGDCQATTNQISGGNQSAINYTSSTGTTFTLSNFTSQSMGYGFQIKTLKFNTTQSQKLTFANFEMLGMPYQSLSSGLSGQSPPPNSTQCSLWMCVNVYSTNVTAGQLSEVAISTFDTIPNDGGLGFSGGDNWTFALPEPWTSEVMNVTALGWTALQQSWTDLADDRVYLNLAGYSASDTAEAFWRGTTDPTGFIERVAASMTNAVRNANGTIDSKYDGTTFEMGVVIRWAWMTLPAVLTLSSIILLVIVMIRTAHSEVGVWKSSPLATLLIDVDQKLRSRLDSIDSDFVSSGVDKPLEETKVTLRKTQRGRFVLSSLDEDNGYS